MSTPAFTKALTLSIVSGATPTAAPHLNFPSSSLQAFGYWIILSISFIVIKPFKYPFWSVIGNFSILLASKISFACSKVVPTGAVIKPLLVIISPTGWSRSLRYLISLFVIIPINFPSSSITGKPEILYLLINSSAW